MPSTSTASTAGHGFSAPARPFAPAAPAPAPDRMPRTAGPVLRRATVVLALAAALGAGTAGVGDAVGLPKAGVRAGGHLSVAYDDGSGHRLTYSVRCTEGWPAEGESEACRRLREIGGPVGPVPEGQACTMIYGGPQTAEVIGTWAGRWVRESYRRTNGCEVARWSRMVPVLPAPTRSGSRRPLAG
ncbi:hypothetical protein [Actinacidiphila sp. ITFR-21]|uniref:hypothetical protein n=1 Tax=Actinacidiphila sp. ITFR-21 TaxID=3075199 RepID=UPI00288A396E|nr:hypothetical protein [Streptomyces sp. ITFR-21]WNI16523.1 hypothetical protein RLT57_14030 [Streptomyces sp. ITFR-21]